MNSEIGGRTLYRFRCSEAAGEPEQNFLTEVLPLFVTNVIVKVKSSIIDLKDIVDGSSFVFSILFHHSQKFLLFYIIKLVQLNI